MATIHDVLRYLVRNQGHRSGDVERDLLLTIDAAEQGYPDLETYKEELDRQAREQAAANRGAAAAADAAANQAQAINTATDADLEAELARRQAIKQAGGGPQTLRQAPVAPGQLQNRGQTFTERTGG